MNKLLIVTAALVLVTATGCTIKDKKAALNSPKEKYSYAIGMSIGTGITKQKLDLDPKVISKGIQDAFAGKTKITEEEMAKILTEFQTEQRAAQEKNMLESGKKPSPAAFSTKLSNQVQALHLNLPTRLKCITAAD